MKNLPDVKGFDSIFKQPQKTIGTSTKNIRRCAYVVNATVTQYGAMPKEKKATLSTIEFLSVWNPYEPVLLPKL